MGWREQYREGSFRNVPFFVERTEGAFGRRAVTHQFPARDDPTTEDMGRRARNFSFEVYLLGEDYFDQRDRLIAAAEKGGPGKLVHPYFGTLEVVCTRCSVRESRAELGIVRIELSFVEAGVADTPGVTLNAKAAADAAKRNILAELEAWFQAKFKGLNEAFAKIENALATLDAAYATIDEVKTVVADVAEFQRTITALREAPAALLSSGADLVRSLTGTIAYGTYPTEGVFLIDRDNAPAQFEEMRGLFAFAPAGTADPDDDAQLIADVTQSIAVACAGGMVAETVYATFEDAKSASDIVLEQIDLLLDTERFSDEVHEAFRVQRVGIMDDLDTRSETLSRLAQKTLPEGVPALVLSNELYGSPDREQDILDRNQIDHPGFVPARVPLDVVIDA